MFYHHGKTLAISCSHLNTLITTYGHINTNTYAGKIVVDSQGRVGSCCQGFDILRCCLGRSIVSLAYIEKALIASLIKALITPFTSVPWGVIHLG